MSTEKFVVPHAESTTPLRHEEFTEEEKKIEKKLLLKIDLTLIPLLWGLFLVSFIDRGNIGNAHIMGMDESLKLKGNEYNIVILVFTLSYMVFGPVASIIFKKLGPKTLGWMMLLWGFFVIGQGLARNFAGMVASRLMMGIFEAGYLAGCAYLIGAYYRRDELLKRYTIFFTASIFAGAVNGFLAALLSKMNGIGGYEGWRWMFLIEGLATIIISLATIRFILPFPEQSTRFSEEQKRILLRRLAKDGTNVAHDTLKLLGALKDYKIWLGTLAYIGAQENASSLMAFQPAMLYGMGFTPVSAQLHTIPIMVTALFVLLICAFIGEKINTRSLFIFLACFMMIIGLAIQLAYPPHRAILYMSLFFLSIGAYMLLPFVVVWVAINTSQGYKRALALGFLVPMGNAGALVSSNVFLIHEAPKYRTGFAVGIGFATMSIVCVAAITGLLMAENRKRDRVRLNMPEVLDEHIFANMGEDHPDFRYKL